MEILIQNAAAETGEFSLDSIIMQISQKKNWRHMQFVISYRMGSLLPAGWQMADTVLPAVFS